MVVVVGGWEGLVFISINNGLCPRSQLETCFFVVCEVSCFLIIIFIITRLYNWFLNADNSHIPHLPERWWQVRAAKTTELLGSLLWGSAITSIYIFICIYIYIYVENLSVSEYLGLLWFVQTHHYSGFRCIQDNFVFYTCLSKEEVKKQRQ